MRLLRCAQGAEDGISQGDSQPPRRVAIHPYAVGKVERNGQYGHARAGIALHFCVLRIGEALGWKDFWQIKANNTDPGIGNSVIDVITIG